jgi:predicted kinase
MMATAAAVESHIESHRTESRLFSPQAVGFDWEALTAGFPWIQDMKGVPQNPSYHAEGDVWVHTGMVARELMALSEWQGLPPRERSMLYASALLHDVAKPACTEFDEAGVPSSPNHARRGEGMARVIAENEGVATYADREMIAKLVRYHGLPLWFLDKKGGPERALIRASMDVRLDHVALLAEADVRGRECADKQNLLDTIELFREEARRLGCYHQPYAFASDHARFMFFANEDYDRGYAAFDDRTFTVTVMCGLPGSGKDTWISRNEPGLPVISLDAIRREMKAAPGEMTGQVTNAGKEEARRLLRERRPFVWNATNLTRMVRDPLIGLCVTYGARVRIVVCHAPLSRTLGQNAARQGSARLPTQAIRDMLAKFDPPSLADCHELVVSDLGAASA